jgi:hypothetical protein
MQKNIRVHRQELTLLLLMLSCQLLITCGRPPGFTTCRGPVYVHLETFDSAETGARAAVRRLSQEIHRCGEAEKYDIVWKWPSSEQERGWRALRYIREDKTSGNIGYEYDPGSGTGETYSVDDSAVDQVAKEGGTLSDFAKYQKRKR